MPQKEISFYLKCNYSTEGYAAIMPWEYLITFNAKEEGKNAKIVLQDGEWPPKGKEWTIVQKEFVKPLDEKNKEGLVELACIEKVDETNKKVLAAISTIDGYSTFWLPLEDIVKKSGDKYIYYQKNK